MLRVAELFFLLSLALSLLACVQCLYLSCFVTVIYIVLQSILLDCFTIIFRSSSLVTGFTETGYLLNIVYCRGNVAVVQNMKVPVFFLFTRINSEKNHNSSC